MKHLLMFKTIFLLISVFALNSQAQIVTDINNADSKPTSTATSTPTPPTEFESETFVLYKDGAKVFLDQMIVRNEDSNEAYIPITPNQILDLTKTNYVWSIINWSEKNAVVTDSTNKLLIGMKINEKVEVVILDKSNVTHLPRGVKRLFVRVVDESLDLITTDTTLLTYRDVLDNYGKRIANQYAVVQMTVRNDSSHNQFLIQDIGIMLDPRQCSKVQEYFNRIKPFYTQSELDANEVKKKAEEKSQLDKVNNLRAAQGLPAITNLTEETAPIDAGEYFDKCITFYSQTFYLPAQVSPIDRSIVMGVGDAGIERSKRKIGFSALRFVSEIGGAFTGIGLLGSDGVKGFNFLGSLILPSADKAVAKSSDNKYENLRNSMPEGQIIVNGRSYKVIKLFIPSEKIFSSNRWYQYKTSLKKKNNAADAIDEAFRLKIMTELFLVAQVKGILINDQSPQVTSKPGGGVNNLLENINQ